MYGRASWGGPMELSMADSGMEDDRSSSLDKETDTRHLGEIHQSWLLRPPEYKKKQYVDLGLIIIGRKFFLRILGALLLAGLLVGIIALLMKLVPRHHPLPPPDNCTVALHKALMFFNAQRSGKLPENNNVSWRGDSCLNDGKSWKASKDLVGGYYDGGGSNKINFPAAFSMTMLSWSVLEYGAKYDAAGELEHVKEIIRWGTDYLLKTFDTSANTIDEIASQVGNSNDSSCWIRPEDLKDPRPVATCQACSDLAGETAAALAAASVVFSGDTIYSQKLVNGSIKLYKFAQERQGRYSGNGDSDLDAVMPYNSTGFWDELLWGGAWLYYATGNISYLHLIKDRLLVGNAGAFSRVQDFGSFGWDNKLAGALIILTRLRLFWDPGYPYEEMLKALHHQTERVMCSYLPHFRTFQRTRGGLIMLNSGKPRSLQYAMNAAFLATLYSDYLEAMVVPGWFCGQHFQETLSLRQFAMSQIDYVLGKNPQSMSYIVGFGTKYPTHAHHRGASIPKDRTTYSCLKGLRWRDSKNPNPNTIVGAMVAGPDKNEEYHDSRINRNYTEPTLAGNAGLVAALAALSGNKTGMDMATMLTNIPPTNGSPPPPPWKP